MQMYLEKKAACTAVEGLIEQNYATVKLPSQIPDLVVLHELYRNFVQRHQNDHENWHFCVPGEHESDVGLIAPRPGKDLKWFFHYNDCLKQQISGRTLSREDRQFLLAFDEIFNVIRQIGLEVCLKLEDYFGPLAQSFNRCFAGKHPYSVSFLRGLFYEAVFGQKGARTHIDRGLFAIHLGDIGGSLIAMKHAHDTEGVNISPLSGEMVIFWGVKSLWITRGQCQPLWHKSVTEPGMDRLALVQFFHVIIKDYLVTDANEANRDFFDKFLPLIESDGYHWC